MKIEIEIGGALFRVGEPSPNHLRIYPVDATNPTEISIAEWKVVKATVDKMFESADALSKPNQNGLR